MEIKHMDSVTRYLQQMVPERKSWMKKMEQFASEHRIPIMEPVSMNFLTQLVRVKQPQSILEIGTAIGYSALRMNEAYPSAKITTIEKNKDMYHRALNNIQLHDKLQQIKVIHGDAIEVINKFKKDTIFDFIFIDAAKGQYKRYFEAVQPFLQREGMIVCDNILFKGYVVNQHKTDHVRLQKLAQKLRTFNDWLSTHKLYHTSIIPIGDGVSISVKIK